LHPHQQKNAEFEVKNRCKNVEEAKALHLLFVTSAYFSNKTDLKRKNALRQIYINK